MKVWKYVALIVIGILLAENAHLWATAGRGYEAVGGEVLLLLLPVGWWVGEGRRR